MIPADIHGLTYARTPQMVRCILCMRCVDVDSLQIMLALSCCLLLLASCGCCRPQCVCPADMKVVDMGGAFLAQNINILTIGSPEGIGGFFPKVARLFCTCITALLLCFAASLFTCR